MLKQQITPKKSKINVNFWSHDQCLSLENFCRSFLKLHRRRMPWECKCFFCCDEHKKNFEFFYETVPVTYEPAVQVAVLNTALLCIKNGYFIAKTEQF